MTDWISVIVVTGVVVAGLGILYKALKEPLDMMFGFFKDGAIWIKFQITGMVDKSQSYTEVVTYG